MGSRWLLGNFKESLGSSRGSQEWFSDIQGSGKFRECLKKSGTFQERSRALQIDSGGSMELKGSQRVLQGRFRGAQGCFRRLWGGFRVYHEVWCLKGNSKGLRGMPEGLRALQEGPRGSWDLLVPPEISLKLTEPFGASFRPPWNLSATPRNAPEAP